ncbi:MAG: hypothetical protein AB7R90_10460 [Reyranellaceae bacterium]
MKTYPQPAVMALFSITHSQRNAYHKAWPEMIPAGEPGGKTFLTRDAAIALAGMKQLSLFGIMPREAVPIVAEWLEELRAPSSQSRGQPGAWAVNLNTKDRYLCGHAYALDYQNLTRVFPEKVGITGRAWHRTDAPAATIGIVNIAEIQRRIDSIDEDLEWSKRVTTERRAALPKGKTRVKGKAKK